MLSGMSRAVPGNRTAWITLLMLGMIAGGCVETYKPAKSLRPKTDSLSVRHQSGGMHYRMEVEDGIWYQLFGTELLVINPSSGHVMDRQDLASPGTTGPAIDMAFHDGELLVVLQDSAVVRLSLEDPRRPWLEETLSSRTLGILPMGVISTGDELLVYGQGGVVDMATGQHLAGVAATVTSVASVDGELLYTSNRRVHRLANDEYVGSASRLEPVTKSDSGDPREFIFIRHEANGSLVGFMGKDVREIDAMKWTVAIPGHVHAARQQGGNLLIVSDEIIRLYDASSESLEMQWEIPADGTRDAVIIDNGSLAMSGDFGRGLWRLEPDRDGEAKTFAHFHPEASGLTKAISDGRNILASTKRGMWHYRIGDTATPTQPTDMTFEDPQKSAVMLDWTFTISEDGTSVDVETPAGRDHLVAPANGHFHCLAASDDVVWLAHDEGIIMVRLPRGGIVVPRGWEGMTEEERIASGVGPLDGMTKLSVRLDGPVFFLEPLLLGGGVAYVSESGGFGVVSEEF